MTLGGSAASRVARIPHVWHLREIYTGFERYWPAYRRLLLSADALPCVSRATRDAARRRRRRRACCTTACRSCRRARRAAPRARRSSLPPDAFVVAILGRISTWKGQDVLIRALAALPSDGDGESIALVAGDPWQGEEARLRDLRALAAQLGVTDRVRFAGFRADVENVYGAADVVAVPSTQPDPLPNAALEAAAAGCCVVAANHGGLPEIIEDGVTGRARHARRSGARWPPRWPAARRPGRARAARRRRRDDDARALLPGAAAERTQALYDGLLAAPAR